MIKLKACPKCHGDLNLERDQYGRYLSCLQCGYLMELPGELLGELNGELPKNSLSEQSQQAPAEPEQLAA